MNYVNEAILNWFISMRLRDLTRAAENKYNRLLLILILIYLFSPFLVDLPIGNLAVLLGFFGAIILVVYQIHPSKEILRLNLGLVVFSVVLRGLSDIPSIPLNFNRFLEVFSITILALLLASSTYWILRELTVAEHVTADLVKGGICAYFLFGFLWAAVYGVVLSFDANAFSSASSTVTRSDLTHFSFTTLTTVGYGDISPVSEIARVLANLEGMVGVLYPAVFIARLVGLHSNY